MKQNLVSFLHVKQVRTAVQALTVAAVASGIAMFGYLFIILFWAAFSM